MACFTDKSDDYVMGYINALLDTQPALIKIAEARDKKQAEYVEKLVVNNTGGILCYLAVFTQFNSPYAVEELLQRYFTAMGMMYTPHDLL